MRLLIAAAELESVERQAKAGYPEECCGLLVGGSGGGGTVRIHRVEPCANQAADRSCRFTISPASLLAIYSRARDRGQRVVGTYHSHPEGVAVPSVLDRESAWPGASWLIIGLGAEGVHERRSWRLADDRFVEEELVVWAAPDEVES